MRLEILKQRLGKGTSLREYISGECHLLNLKCRVGKRLSRNPPTLRSNHNELFKECLTARPVGYGTNGVPYPPYVEQGTALE